MLPIQFDVIVLFVHPWRLLHSQSQFPAIRAHKVSGLEAVANNFSPGEVQTVGEVPRGQFREVERFVLIYLLQVR